MYFASMTIISYAKSSSPESVSTIPLAAPPASFVRLPRLRTPDTCRGPKGELRTMGVAQAKRSNWFSVDTVPFPPPLHIPCDLILGSSVNAFI